MSAVERAAEVLAEHRYSPSRLWPDGSKPEALNWNPGCSCGLGLYYFQHQKHVAEALAAAGCLRDHREGVDLLDGSLDATVGAEGENPEAPTDHKVRDLAALAYLVVTCEALGVETDEEWDRFEFARAIHRRVRAVLDGRPPARDDREGGAVVALKMVLDACNRRQATADALADVLPHVRDALTRRDDREGETVTEWAIQRRDGSVTGPGGDRQAMVDLVAYPEYPDAAALVSRQRTTFPDVVTDWTPVTDSGDPS